MRILLINNSHSIKGGADRVYFNTGKLLEENNQDIKYFSTIDKGNEETEFSKYFVHVSDKRSANLATKISGAKDYIYNRDAYSNLSRLIRDCKPDIAHIHLFCGGLSPSILKALKVNNVPIVQTVHDYRLLCPANAFLDAENKICEKCINKSYFQCSVKKCVDGNFFYSTMVALEAYYRKYIINPLDYIDHFVFVSRFSQLKHIEFDSRFTPISSHLFNFSKIPDDYPLADKGKYFLYFGRLSKEKGLITLVNAAIKSGIQLKIVGTGPMYNEILGFSRDYSNIQVLGHQSGSDLSGIIEKASFIFVPSEWYENNPMTVIEAYAVGKPVIGARIGGIPEIVIDGRTGFLFDSRDADDLERIIQKARNLSESEYADMSGNARSFALANFSPGPHYAKLMQIYTKLIR
jgi:glycosyltransferase involved in cell wall biosynthesis